MRRTFETNVFANLDPTQQVIRKFVDAGTAGRVVIVSSMGGLLTAYGLGAYCASKHALEAIAATLRNELAPTDITVQTITPAGTTRASTIASPIRSTGGTTIRSTSPERTTSRHIRRDREGSVRSPGDDRGDGLGHRPDDRKYRNVWPPAIEHLVKQVQEAAWTRPVQPS